MALRRIGGLTAWLGPGCNNPIANVTWLTVEIGAVQNRSNTGPICHRKPTM
jgi:hypothetical protein